MGSSSSRQNAEPVKVRPVESKGSSPNNEQSNGKMPKYTLINFNVRGRGEVARILFALADVEYEDKRLPFEGDEWPNLKPQMPFAQIPALKIDDVILCQSEAIEFFIAKTYGFAGSSPIDESRILMIGNCVKDTLAPLFKLYSLPEEETEAKAAIMKSYVEEQMPNYFGMLEKMLVSNKDGNGYFVGDKISMADIQIVGIYDWLEVTGITLDMADYPDMKAHKERVKNEPRIAAWVAKRPKTRF